MVGKPKSQLFIVPGATHVTMVTEKAPLIGGVVVMSAIVIQVLATSGGRVLAWPDRRVA